MGGSGSGNYFHWWRPAKKAVVEDCCDLDANRWVRQGILRAGVRQSGGWRWTDAATGEVRASIGYEVETTEPDDPRVWLAYTATRDGVAEPLWYAVQLQRTRVHGGGLRWWFTCPLVVNHRPCGRRVGKLYLPPTGRYFGCRHCYDLTYTSCQEAHSGDAFFRRMARPGEDPAELRRAFNHFRRMNR
jgi:hypothetical protein